MGKRRTIAGTPHRLLGVYPWPVARSYEVLLRERGIPAYLEDVNPEVRPYTGGDPVGTLVYVWVPEVAYAEARGLVEGTGGAGS